MLETFDLIQLPIFHAGDYDKKQDLCDVIQVIMSTHLCMLSIIAIGEALNLY